MSTKKPALLGVGIIATKGSATPSTVASSVATSPEQKKNNNERIAITIRLTPEDYRRLKLHGLQTRKSNQDIFVEALEAYLRNNDKR